jgi:S-sulfosulfanyl-L-cysteine sulfohydrolase
MDRKTRAWAPLNLEAEYTYASYYYARDPDLINTVPAQAISVVKDKNGGDLDAVEVVARYLASLPNRTTAPQTGRLKLLKALPAASFGSPEVQPWRGVTPSTPPPPAAGAGGTSQRIN